MAGVQSRVPRQYIDAHAPYLAPMLFTSTMPSITSFVYVTAGDQVNARHVMSLYTFQGRSFQRRKPNKMYPDVAADAAQATTELQARLNIRFGFRANTYLIFWLNVVVVVAANLPRSWTHQNIRSPVHVEMSRGYCWNVDGTAKNRRHAEEWNRRRKQLMKSKGVIYALFTVLQKEETNSAPWSSKTPHHSLEELV